MNELLGAFQDYGAFITILTVFCILLLAVFLAIVNIVRGNYKQMQQNSTFLQNLLIEQTKIFAELKANITLLLERGEQ